MPNSPPAALQVVILHLINMLLVVLQSHFAMGCSGSVPSSEETFGMASFLYLWAYEMVDFFFLLYQFYINVTRQCSSLLDVL